MKFIRYAVAVLAICSGVNAFAYNDNDPNDDFRTCSPGFSRDVFGDCQPNYTFPGGIGHDDYGTPDRPRRPSRKHTCYASDRRGNTFAVRSRSLTTAKNAALAECWENSRRPRSCHIRYCN
jgi:hypothetical protein